MFSSQTYAIKSVWFVKTSVKLMLMSAPLRDHTSVAKIHPLVPHPCACCVAQVLYDRMNDEHHTSNTHFWVWGLICAVLWSCATLGVLLAQTHGGFGWWVLLIHPRDPATFLGMLTAPLFSATYEWINNTYIMFALIVVRSFHGWRFVRDGTIVWISSGLSMWVFGNSQLYYMGVSPLCYAMCAWLVVHNLVHRNMFHKLQCW